MTTLLVTHPSYARHETPIGHPERVDRILAVERALADPPFDALTRIQAPEASVEMSTECHPLAYTEALRRLSPRDGERPVQIDGDTLMSPGSFEAALRGVGGAALAVDHVMTGKVQNAFSASRPPGHHAEPKRAMGFCLFNNVAIAARHAQRAHGAERVAILDFDVHHGNGTQAIFWNDPSVLYASTHQMPLYPGTGAPSETGEADTIVNAPLRPGQGGREFREAMQTVILPRMLTFVPDLILVSAGFDAHERDPLGSLNFVDEDYAWATAMLLELAAKTAGGRIVSVLEGGYDLTALARSSAVHVATLMQA